MSSGNSLDKFGRKTKTQRVIVNNGRGIGFKLSPEGDYDMQRKRIVNLGEPTLMTDSATANYVEAVNRETYDVLVKALQDALAKAMDIMHNKIGEVEKRISEEVRIFYNRVEAIELNQQSNRVTQNKLFTTATNKIERLEQIMSEGTGTFSKQIAAVEGKQAKVLELFGTFDKRIAEIETKELSRRITENKLLVDDCLKKVSEAKLYAESVRIGLQGQINNIKNSNHE